MTRRADVGALRALHEAATEGPWEWSLDSGSLVLHHGDVSMDHIMSVDICRHCFERPPTDHGAPWCTAGRKPDHDLIASMRNALPGLLDEVEALRAALPEDPYLIMHDDSGAVRSCYSCAEYESNPHAPDCVWLRGMGGGS